jgi:hypothetical protein
MYADLFKGLGNLKTRIARFRRVALHLHSPNSQDWPREGSDTTRNDRDRFTAANGVKEFATELRPHLDLVAITDHMRCDFATRVSAGTFAVMTSFWYCLAWR